MPYEIAIPYLFPGFIFQNTILGSLQLLGIDAYSITWNLLGSTFYSFIITQLLCAFIIGYLISEVFTNRLKSREGMLFELSSSYKLIDKFNDWIYRIRGKLIWLKFYKNMKIPQKDGSIITIKLRTIKYISLNILNLILSILFLDIFALSKYAKPHFSKQNNKLVEYYIKYLLSKEHLKEAFNKTSFSFLEDSVCALFQKCITLFQMENKDMYIKLDGQWVRAKASYLISISIIIFFFVYIVFCCINNLYWCYYLIALPILIMYFHVKGSAIHKLNDYYYQVWHHIFDYHPEIFEKYSQQTFSFNEKRE